MKRSFHLLRLVGAVLALLCLTPSAASGQGKPKWGIRAEAGPEFDTNVLRVAGGQGEPTPAPLIRLITNAFASFRRGNHNINLGVGGGAKLFFGDGQPADEGVVQASGRWDARIAPGQVLGLGVQYYDAFQRASQRDFRSGSAIASLNLGLPKWRADAALSAGYLGLMFKPNDAFSFHSAVLGARFSRRLTGSGASGESTWTAGLSYRLAYRGYRGNLLGQREPCVNEPDTDCFFLKEQARRDLDHLARFSIDYLGSAAASFWYALEVNQSNSYGESYTRHVLGLTFTSLLLWKVYVTATGVLQISRFADQLFGQVSTQSFVTIDEENRSRLVVQIAREIAEHWAINLRYSLYVNESGSVRDGGAIPGFLRQTFFVGVRFEYDSD